MTCRISTYMSNEKIDMLQGTLDLFILKALKLGPMARLRISVLVRQTSEEVLRVTKARFIRRFTGWSAAVVAVRMGSFRKQSQGQVLQADRGGPKTVA